MKKHHWHAKAGSSKDIQIHDGNSDEFGPSTSSEYDLIYKVILIGESGVGKTSLLRRYEDSEGTLPKSISTIGIDFRVVDLSVDGLRVRAQLWDTMGQERYRTMTKNYFRRSKGVLLVYDVTNRLSLFSIQSWIDTLKQFNLDREEVFILGNKIDLEREVSYEEGKRYAESFGMKYFEVSANTGENVKHVIQKLIYNMKDKTSVIHRESFSIVNDKWYVSPDEPSGSGYGTIGRNLRTQQKPSTSCCCVCGSESRDVLI